MMNIITEPALYGLKCLSKASYCCQGVCLVVLILKQAVEYTFIWTGEKLIFYQEYSCYI